MKPDLIASLFQDIWCEGSVKIRKTKLLWLFGRKNDGQSFWDMVIEQWEEFAPNAELKGALWGDTYTLSCAPIEKIKGNWTN